jgi:hypothetical protein
MEWVLVTAVKTELALVVQAVPVQWRIATVAQMEPVPVVQDVIAQDQLCMVNVNAVQMVVIVQDLVCKEHVLLVEDILTECMV